MLWFPAVTSSGGDAAQASSGLFDERDAPPWDTWVALVQENDRDRPDSRYLVAWIPPELSSPAGAGIAAAANGSLAWFDERATAFSAMIAPR